MPGVAIAVVKDDHIVFAKGYGVRELGKPAPVDERTLFAIGSSSKAFTAASIAHAGRRRQAQVGRSGDQIPAGLSALRSLRDARADRPRPAEPSQRARPRRPALVRLRHTTATKSCAASATSSRRGVCAPVTATRTSCTSPPARSSRRHGQELGRLRARAHLRPARHDLDAARASGRWPTQTTSRPRTPSSTTRWRRSPGATSTTSARPARSTPTSSTWRSGCGSNSARASTRSKRLISTGVVKEMQTPQTIIRLEGGLEDSTPKRIS